jgi:beta-lactamase class D
MTGPSKCTYSIQPESGIHGEVHYYIGLMHSNGWFVDQVEEKAQNYFKAAHIQ